MNVNEAIDGTCQTIDSYVRHIVVSQPLAQDVERSSRRYPS
jgi:hypothetical protein